MCLDMSEKLKTVLFLGTKFAPRTPRLCDILDDDENKSLHFRGSDRLFFEVELVTLFVYFGWYHFVLRCLTVYIFVLRLGSCCFYTTDFFISEFITAPSNKIQLLDFCNEAAWHHKLHY